MPVAAWAPAEWAGWICKKDVGRRTLVNPRRQLTDHELTLSLELLGKQSVVSANNLPEVEDLRDTTRLALAGHDIRGDVFHWSKQLEDPKRFTLSTERGSWMLEASGVGSIGQALDLLFHEPSIVGVAERGRFVYCRVYSRGNGPGFSASMADLRPWTTADTGAAVLSFRVLWCLVIRLAY